MGAEVGDGNPQVENLERHGLPLRGKIALGLMTATIAGGAYLGFEDGKSDERATNQEDLATARAERSCATAAEKFWPGAVVRLGRLTVKEQKDCGFVDIAETHAFRIRDGGEIVQLDVSRSKILLPNPDKLRASATDHLEAGNDFSHGREISSAILGGFAGFFGFVALVSGGVMGHEKIKKLREHKDSEPIKTNQ